MSGWADASAPHLLGVALGSGVGAMARAWADRAVTARVGATRLPWATLAVNVAGSFLLGLVLAITAGSAAQSDQALRLVLGTGLCGGLTTFSTFSVETFQLLRTGRGRAGVVYGALTIGLTMTALVLGDLLGSVSG